MNVLMLTNLFPPQVLGGYELLAHDVAMHLRHRGHVVHVLTAKGVAKTPFVHPRLSFIRPFGEPLGRERLRSLWVDIQNSRVAKDWLREHGRPDAVLAMSQRRIGLGALRTLARAGIGTVATVNDDWPLYFAPHARLNGALRWLSRVERAILPHLDLRRVPFVSPVYLSETLRDAVLQSETGLPSGVVHAQGVDTDLFHPRPFRPIPPAPELLFVGRLHPSKGPDIAIRAVASLRERNVLARIRLVGAPVTESYGDGLRRLAASLGISGSVRFEGHVPRCMLPEIIRRADVFLFPNRDPLEGQGLTYLEAMSCGVPVVAHPTGGARDLLLGTDAFECAGDNSPSAFADAIVRLGTCERRTAFRVREALSLLSERASLARYVDVVEWHLREAARGCRVGNCLPSERTFRGTSGAALPQSHGDRLALSNR